MKIRHLAIAVFGGLILAGVAQAKQYDPERSAPQDGCDMQCPCAPEQGMHQHKFMKHRQMAHEFRQMARHERRMARMHRRGFCEERFAPPGMDRECPMGPPPMMRERMRHQNEFFGGPEMNPDHPIGHPPFMRERMQFRNEQFGGPGMNPEHPMGPPPHMRFRDGNKTPRAL